MTIKITLPDTKYYCFDQMSKKDAKNFQDWYAKENVHDTVFHFKQELIKYCIMDVAILRKACLLFLKYFLGNNNVNPFQEAVTITSACNLVFRRNFLRTETIGIIPSSGYGLCENESLKALQWLMWTVQFKNINIRYAFNGREIRLSEGQLEDGYDFISKAVYEFHGCEQCYSNQTEALFGNSNNIMSMRRERTEMKIRRIKEAGYRVIEIWECNFDRFVRMRLDLREFFAQNKVFQQAPLNPRDEFLEGRTNAVKLYHKCNDNEKTRYMNVHCTRF